MTEVTTSDPAITSESQPDIGSAIFAEAPESNFDGLNYWETEGRHIMDTAFIRARSAKENGEKLPSWASAILNGYARMRKTGEHADHQLIIDSEYLRINETIEDQATLKGSVESWYRRLGPTNESPELAPLLLSMVDKLEAEPRTTKRDMLEGNILQDISMRTEDTGFQTDLLRRAITVYERVAKNVHADPQDRRKANVHILDSQHKLLSLEFQAGRISDTDFNNTYEQLQVKSINNLMAAMELPNSKLGNGELFEMASLIFLRHRYWSNETAERYDVRASLIREDKPEYPWPAKYNEFYPMWSFDSVIQDKQTSNISRIQLKDGNFHQNSENHRVYLPNAVKVVRSEIESGRFRGIVQNGMHAIKITYASMHELNDRMRENMAQTIDQEALDELENIYKSITH